MAPSDNDRSELLDGDVLPPEFPPDHPMGVDEYGTTPQEERINEPIEEREARHEPEEIAPRDEPVLLLDETEDGFGFGGNIDEGETGDDVLGELGDANDPGDKLGEQLGPPPSGFAADRVPLAAEEDAVHVVDIQDDGEYGDAGPGRVDPASGEEG